MKTTQGKAKRQFTQFSESHLKLCHRIEPDLRDAFKDACERNGEYMGAVIIELISGYVAKNQAKVQSQAAE